MKIVRVHVGVKNTKIKKKKHIYRDNGLNSSRFPNKFF